MLVCAFRDLTPKEMKVNKQQHCLRSDRLDCTVNEKTVLCLNILIVSIHLDVCNKKDFFFLYFIIVLLPHHSFSIL